MDVGKGRLSSSAQQQAGTGETVIGAPARIRDRGNEEHHSNDIFGRTKIALLGWTGLNRRTMLSRMLSETDCGRGVSQAAERG